MRIKIKYQTGDSFHTEIVTDILEVEWHNEDVIKENINAIKEHSEFLEKLEDRWYNRKNDIENIINEAKTKFWFIDGEYLAVPLYKVSIKLKLDNGSFIQLGTFWCGYFEQLLECDICL